VGEEVGEGDDVEEEVGEGDDEDAATWSPIVHPLPASLRDSASRHQRLQNAARIKWRRVGGPAGGEVSGGTRRPAIEGEALEENAILLEREGE
jgi:hypothetical protein